MSKFYNYIEKLKNMKSFTQITHTIKNSFMQRKHIFFVNDVEIRDALLEIKAYKKLKKKYSYILNDMNNKEFVQNKNELKPEYEINASKKLNLLLLKILKIILIFQNI